ncbi:MAG: hypothetical protein JW863_06540 [Chitinispirillaceae bacterium]|nr:hypothetical protein [Chitinispirillaceae bacterium]
MKFQQSIVSETVESFHHHFAVIAAIFGCIWCTHAQTIDLPAPLPDSLAESLMIDGLGSWYNLGRISGNKTYANALVPYFYEGFSLIDLYHFSSGNEHIEAGMSTLSLLGVNEDSGLLLFMLPGGSIAAAPSPGNRLTATVSSTNFYFGVADVAHTGFQDPLNFVNRYRWDFLSRRGIIRVEPDQYENSFFFGPQLNAGQVRVHIEIDHTISSSESYYPRFFSADSYLSAGLFDNLSGTGHFSIIHSRSNTGFTDLVQDSISASGTVQLRTEPVTASFWYSYERPFYSREDTYPHDPYFYPSEYSDPTLIQYEYHLHRLFSDVTFITGKRIRSLAEVNGNWDGYFSPRLGSRQFLAYFHPEGVFTRSSDREDTRTFTLDNTLRFGCTPFLTIGEQGRIRVSTAAQPLYDVSLTATLSNIPLRTRGPEQVSKFEYTFGYWPRKGEFRIDGTIGLPLPRFNQHAYSPLPVLEHLSNGTVNTIYDFDPLNSLSPAAVSGYNRPFIDDYDHRLTIAAGITGNFILSNEFDMKAVRQEYLYNGAIESENYREIVLTGTSDNTIFADQIGFHLGDVEGYLHSLNAAFFWQTSNSVSGRDRFDFLLSWVFTAGF